MVSFQDFRSKYEVRGKFSSTELYFCSIKELKNKMPRIDMEVYLPTKGRNLQREFVWTHLQCQELIMSILIGRNVPPIRYVSLINPEKGMDNDFIQIIDGKQRLSAIWHFINDEFSIEIDGYLFRYSSLPSDFRNAIDRFHITGQAMYQEFNKNDQIIPITDEDKIKWFKFLNFSGTPVELHHLSGLE